MGSVDLWSKSKAELIDNMEELSELTAVTLVDARNRVAHLEAQAQELRKALEDAVSCFGDADAFVSEERKEAWESALNYQAQEEE
jgi:predicted  nucleic acid-binding Zn-ribbon protein